LCHYICCKLDIIYEGKILLEGNAKELLENPEARRVYLGENFKL
jgi:lipopolysaccharide export system ATP-binding protein